VIRFCMALSLVVLLYAAPAWAQAGPQNAPSPAGQGQDVPTAGAPATPPVEEPLAEDEAMVLNFEKADVREVIHSLATALGLSYTIDPRITGEVTIRTTGRIPRRELSALFNQILRANGIAAVKQGELYHVVPVEEAKARAIVPRSGTAQRESARDDNFVIEVFGMRHVAAEEMANILTPFLTPGGEIFSYPRANTVVVVDLRSNVVRLRELATTFDVDGFSNLRARVYKLKEGDPEEMTNEILSLLGPYGAGAGAGEGAGGLFMIPLYRLNSIVAFAYDPSAFVEIERWLTLLDIPPEKGSGRQTFVYNVENAKAVDLAAVLNELFGDGGQGGGGGLGRNPGGTPAGVGLFGAGGTSGTTGRPGSRGGAGGAGGGANRLSRGGGGGFGGGGGGAGGVGMGGGGANFGNQAGGQQGLGGAGRGLQGGGAGGIGGAGAAGGVGGRRGQGGAAGAVGGVGAGQAGTGGGVLGVVLPGGTQAAQGGAGGVLGGPGQLGGPPGPPPVFKQEVRIVADEVTNSLVVLATKRDYQLILDVLRRIDVVPRQVVLEVMIAEVVLGKGLEFGVSYAFSDGSLGNVLPAGTTPDDDDDDPDSPLPDTTGNDLFDVLDGVSGLIGTAQRIPGAGAFAVINHSDQFQIFLNALQARTNVKMLAAPHVIAADNREAYILVGQSIPILTNQTTFVNSNGTTSNSVQYRDTGKILSVLPQVNSKGLVNLQIRQEVSAVLETQDGAQTSFGETGSPAFSTREVETTLVVQNGATVLIGGIIDDQITHTRGGIPYLMDIPVLGWAFRSERNINNRTELLITITPYVILNREEADSVTEDFSSRIDGLRQLQDAMRSRHRVRETGAGRAGATDFEGVPIDERR